MGRTFSAVPYTYLKRGVYYFVTAVIVCTSLSVSANTNPINQKALDRFWKNIEVYFPSVEAVSTASFNLPKASTVSDLENYQGKPHKTILLLHGCGGIRSHMKKWANFLSSSGFLVLMPNAYAIKGIPKPTCSPGATPSQTYYKIAKIRRKQIGVIVRQIKSLPAVDSKNVFLMGHSQGAATARVTKAGFFKGVILSGLKCSVDYKVSIVKRVPILFLNHASDPWFPGRGNCSTITNSRKASSEVLLAGSGHDTFYSSRARDEVLKFLERNQF